MCAIIACIWQGLAVAWLTALLLRTTSRLNAATRHTIWWLALASVLALPFAHFAALTIELPGPALAATVDADTPALLLPAPPDWLIACVAGAWLGIVLLGFARLVHAVRLVTAVKRRSLRVDEAVQRSLKLWTAVRGTGRAPELRVSSELSGACALGLSGRPVILVSTRLIAALNPEELDQIVMHEHAHLARYDDWLRIVQSLVTALCGVHPAVHFISARIDLEREAACDDRVVAQTGAADRYASCLANAADLALKRQPPSLEPILAPHASQSRGALVTRVRRLLDPHTSRDAHLKWASTGASILAFSTAVLISPAAQPLVVVLGAITGAPQMHPAPIVRQTGWRSSAFAPSLPPAVEALPSSWSPDAVRTSETVTAAPDVGAATPRSEAVFSYSGVPSPVFSYSGGPSPVSTYSGVPPPVSLDRQFSWRMPGGIAIVATPKAEPSRPLPATPVEPWSIPNTGQSQRVPSLVGEPDQTRESAWKAAGYTGAAVGIGVARAGVATGAGSRKAGTAVAGFFSRAGKAVAGGF
jgi:beta-lactamase regulating signal transducer with metallopeptidase domain